tara:strand:+ start:742 stop:1326 length:585 start_codon:yes stop_codon:yes gene_type:complete
MTKSIDFYFDFISPYSYLAYKKINNLNLINKIDINYKPVFLGGLHKLGGITAPAFNERKMKNMKSDCELVASKNNIEFKWNKKFPINSLDLMRGYLSINDQIKKKYFEVCFDSYWKDDLDISENKNMIKILEICKIDQNKFLDDIKDQKIKDELKYLTDIAFKNDIFGAPTFVVNKKIFWGQDRLEYAIDEVLI